MSTFPMWVDAPTTPAFQDNVPVWPPTQPGDPNAGSTVPGSGKIAVPVYKIAAQADVDSLVASLNASGIQTGPVFDDYANDPYPVTWGAETRRGFMIPIPALAPPGAFWSVSVRAKALLPSFMARGVGAPGFWRYEPNNIFAMMMTSGLVWYPLS